MKYTLQDQIRAVQTAMRGASMLVLDEDIPDFAGALNDAGSTLAALNLTKDLPERKEYFDRILVLTDNYAETPHEIIEEQIQEKILAMSYDRLKLQEDRIKELEEALKGMVDVYSFGGSGDSEARHNATNKAKSLLKQ